MQIGLDDLDTPLAEMFSQYVRARMVAADTTEAERRVAAAVKKRGSDTGSWLLFALPAASFALIMGGVQFVETLPALTAGMWAASFASSWANIYLAGRKKDPVAGLRAALTAEQLRAVLPQLTLSRAERVYADTVLLLVEADAPTGPGAGAMTESEARDFLGNLNRLLQSNRELEAQRERILAARGSGTVESLAEERAVLVRSAASSDDPQARADLQRSLELCDARLGDVAALERSLKRIDAQQQLVFQTLAAAQSSLARRLSAQAPLSNAATDLEELQESVYQVQTQTASLEAAVQEVVTLRGSG